MLTLVLTGVILYYSLLQVAIRDMRKEMACDAAVLRENMLEYQAFPWLIDYWKTNGQEMDLPEYGAPEQDTDWQERHAVLSDRDLRKITSCLLFSGDIPGEGEEKQYVLGANWAFDLRLHPGVKESPVLIRKEHALLQTEAQDFPLGIMKELSFQSFSFTLEPGEALLLYTDGVTEAKGKASEEVFGEDRLLAALHPVQGGSAEAYVCSAENALKRK